MTDDEYMNNSSSSRTVYDNVVSCTFCGLSYMSSTPHVCPGVGVAKSGRRPLPVDSANPNIFDQAKDLIYGQRNKDYGHPRENFSTTAMLWNTYIDQRQVTHERGTKEPFGLNEYDVAYMMTLLKIARLANDPQHRDSRVDVCGYMGCADRLEEQEP